MPLGRQRRQGLFQLESCSAGIRPSMTRLLQSYMGYIQPDNSGGDEGQTWPAGSWGD